MPPKQIILIDDDPIINMISQKIISLTYNFAIESYTRAHVALRHLADTVQLSEQSATIVIFLDINMPDMDGWEFLHEFEQLPAAFLNRFTVFILTSSIDHEDIEKSKKYKTVQGFISKPLTEDKIKVLAE